MPGLGTALKPPLHVAYLVGHYPAISHTFIDREIQSLRESGITVDTISLRRVSSDNLLTAHEREEALRTWQVLPPTARGLLGAHGRAWAKNPARYFRTLKLALSLGRPGAKGLVWKLFYFIEAVLVADWMSRRRITHVHAHFANSASWVALLAAEVRGETWSFTMHGPSEFDDVTIYALEEKVARAQFTACIGSYCAAQLKRVVDPGHWDSLVIVRCGVRLPSFAPALIPPFRPPGETVILSVGRLAADKGQRDLLLATQQLRHAGWAGTLRIVGDGPDRRALEEMVTSLGLGDSVEMLGAVGQDELPAMYREADVFASSSFAEGIPVVLMEAMATGLPVVAPGIMGIGELVHHNKNGLTFIPGKASDLADALLRLDADITLRRRLGTSARETVAREFSHPNVVAPLISALYAARDVRAE